MQPGSEHAAAADGPSFAALLGEAHARKAHPVTRRMFDKVDARQLLEELGAPVVNRFELIGTLDRLQPSMLASPSVIKPRRGYSSRGVVALQPIASGRWLEVLSGREVDFEGVRGLLATALVTLPLLDSWVVEDLMPGDPPCSPVDDVKLCVFGEEVVCSFVRANAPRGFQWFDANWNPVDTGVHALYRRADIKAPSLRQELVDAARAIGQKLALPFIRVDFLVNMSGFVIGELTPFPGWYRDFTPEWDTILGMHYQRADSTLRAASAPSPVSTTENS